MARKAVDAYPKIDPGLVKKAFKDWYDKEVADNPLYSDMDKQDILEEPELNAEKWAGPVGKALGCTVSEYGWAHHSHDMSSEEGIERYVKAVAKTLGIPDGIEVVPDYETKMFNLNGKSLVYGGSYTRASKDSPPRITVYPSKMDNPTAIAQVLQHEFTHHKFRVAQMDTDFTDQFAVNYETLKVSDGVTAYSREWWKSSETNSRHIIHAINETLAEMATLGPVARKGLGKEWQDLYDKLNTSYVQGPKA